MRKPSIFLVFVLAVSFTACTKPTPAPVAVPDAVAPDVPLAADVSAVDAASDATVDAASDATPDKV